ncbi:hypothetical protein BKA70DRAFT_1565098 [Coprinopsis sp. MPI-PUGE-AT-0042]|nr:hypothetical protein BKA70DRAFT_1565098 [Coprinopsis sp. MPI-PUGE-AT-0042]
MTDAGVLGIQPNGYAEQWDGVRGRVLPFLPSLQSFSIKGPEFEEVFRLLLRPHIDDMLLQLSAPVTNIDIASVSIHHSTILALSRLPQVTKLSLSLGLRDDPIAEGHNGRPLAFPALTEIEVNITEEERGNIFLGQLCAPSLATCTMSFKLPSRTSNLPIESFLSAFSQHDRQNLTHILIDDCFADNWNTGTFSFIVTYQGLQCLSSCRRLVSIDVFPSTCSDPIADNELASAFSSWPKLEELHLRKHDEDTIPDGLQLTAGGVCKALTSCPSLRSLTLPCNFQKLLNSSEDDIKAHPCLESWNVLYSPISAGRTVGLWIKAQFPALRSVDYMGPPQWCARSSTDDDEDVWNAFGGTVFVALDQWTDVAQVLREEADVDEVMHVDV